MSPRISSLGKFLPVPTRWLGRSSMAIAMMLAALLGPADIARAGGLVISAPDLTVAPGSSGSFDVLIANTNLAGGDSYDVSADTLELTLSGPAGITFTDVTIGTVAPYIYVQSGTTLPGGLPLDDGITFPNTDFTVGDSEWNPPDYYRSIGPGDVYGLARVSYSVGMSATAGSVDPIAIGANTGLTEVDGITPIPFTAQGGAIAISTVPEPSSLILMACAVVGVGVVTNCRRGRAGR
jgi:hypothetical protein